MSETAIYRKYARYYDLIYSFKDYKGESRILSSLISKYKKTKGKQLLDIACGTGKHLAYLKKSYDCTGCDLNKDMLAVAKKNVKGVKFIKQDMTKLRLYKRFDVITNLFSAIGYVKTYANLQKTVKGMFEHLKPGGVVILGPWLTKSVYKPGLPHMNTYSTADVKIARLSVSKIRDNISVMEMHHLVAEKNKDIIYFIDKHELGLFEINRTIKIMKDVGFNAKHIKNSINNDRGLYICTKPIK